MKFCNWRLRKFTFDCDIPKSFQQATDGRIITKKYLAFYYYLNREEKFLATNEKCNHYLKKLKNGNKENKLGKFIILMKPD